MVFICLFNSPPQYCLLSRWFFPDPKKVLWVSDSLHIVHNESSHLTRGPGSGLLSLLFWPLSMMLIVAPLWERNISFEPQIMFRYHQVPDLPDFVDLAAPLPNDRSNHVVGDRHLMPGFWFSIQRYQNNGIFMNPNIFVHFVQKGYVRPEVPISAIISPRPASTTSSGSPSKICYCVERGTEK